jgi:hypothetical protein
MSEPIAEFEREKWEAEYGLRKREVEIKERDAKRSRWSNRNCPALEASPSETRLEYL